MLERCSGTINSQELPEQRSGVQKMSSSVGQLYTFVSFVKPLRVRCGKKTSCKQYNFDFQSILCAHPVGRKISL